MQAMLRKFLNHVLCLICSIYLCNGLPIGGNGKPSNNGIVFTSQTSTYLIIGIASLICFTVSSAVCVCCNRSNLLKSWWNNRQSPYVRNGLSASTDQEITVFPPPGFTEHLSSSSTSQIYFEPLPDASSKYLNNNQISDWFAEPVQNFPRSQLQYVRKLGTGWFGQVLAGRAAGINFPSTNVISSKVKSETIAVVVKSLREDATHQEKVMFLQELRPYKDLNHINVLKVLSFSLETDPFLVILQHCSKNDLKNLLVKETDLPDSKLVKMMQDITCGLSHMHENGFIHTDLAARNCLVDESLTVKIGDYGLGIELHKDEYYLADNVALPIRWCSPETLLCTDSIIDSKPLTKEANVWTLAVTLWEVFSRGKLPYEDFDDNLVIQKVLTDKTRTLHDPLNFSVHPNIIMFILNQCWQVANKRPSAAKVLGLLVNFPAESEALPDFEQRWSHLSKDLMAQSHNISVSTSAEMKFESDFDPDHLHGSPTSSLKNINGSAEDLDARIAANFGSAIPSWLGLGEGQAIDSLTEEITDAIQRLDQALADDEQSSINKSNFKVGEDSLVLNPPGSANLHPPMQREEEKLTLRLEQGDFSELVRLKSQSVQDLMRLTVVDDGSDSDKTSQPGSLVDGSLSNCLPDKNFSSESNLKEAIRDDGFMVELERLQAQHKYSIISEMSRDGMSSIEYSTNFHENPDAESQSVPQESPMTPRLTSLSQDFCFKNVSPDCIISSRNTIKGPSLPDIVSHGVVVQSTSSSSSFEDDTNDSLGASERDKKDARYLNPTIAVTCDGASICEYSPSPVVTGDCILIGAMDDYSLDLFSSAKSSNRNKDFQFSESIPSDAHHLNCEKQNLSDTDSAWSPIYGTVSSNIGCQSPGSESKKDKIHYGTLSNIENISVSKGEDCLSNSPDKSTEAGSPKDLSEYLKNYADSSKIINSKSAPDIKENSFVVKDDSSEIKTVTPEFQAATPKIQGAIPEIQAAIPEIQGAIPEIQGAIPEIQGAIPEIQAAIPEIQGAIPEIQVAIPEIQAATPELQAATPELQAATPELQAATSELQAATPELQAATPELQAATPELQAATPELQAATPELQAATPELQAATPELQAATPEIQATTPELQAATPELQAATPELQAATPELQAATPELQAATPELQAATPELQAATPELQAATPELQAATPELQAASPELQAATPEFKAASPDNLGETDDNIFWEKQMTAWQEAAEKTKHLLECAANREMTPQETESNPQTPISQSTKSPYSSDDRLDEDDEGTYVSYDLNDEDEALGYNTKELALLRSELNLMLANQTDTVQEDNDTMFLNYRDNLSPIKEEESFDERTNSTDDETNSSVEFTDGLKVHQDSGVLNSEDFCSPVVDGVNDGTSNEEAKNSLILEDLEDSQNGATIFGPIKRNEDSDDLMLVDTETNKVTLIDSGRPQSTLAFLVEREKVESELPKEIPPFDMEDDVAAESLPYDLEPSSLNCDQPITDELHNAFTTPDMPRYHSYFTSNLTSLPSFPNHDDTDDHRGSTDHVSLPYNVNFPSAYENHDFETKRELLPAVENNDNKNSKIISENANEALLLDEPDRNFVTMSFLGELYNNENSQNQEEANHSLSYHSTKSEENDSSDNEDVIEEEIVDVTPAKDEKETPLRTPNDLADLTWKEEEPRYTPDWETDSNPDIESSSTSGEFVWQPGDAEVSVIPQGKSLEDLKEESQEDSESGEEDFVPSTWNSTLIPNRSLLKIPESTANEKKSVHWKRERHHRVYEYPPEPQSWHAETPHQSSRKTWNTHSLDYLTLADVFPDWELKGDFLDDDAEDFEEFYPQGRNNHVGPYPIAPLAYEGSTGAGLMSDDFYMGSTGSAFAFSRSSFAPADFFSNKKQSTPNYEYLYPTSEPSEAISTDGTVSSSQDSNFPSDSKLSREKLRLDLPTLCLSSETADDNPEKPSQSSL